jgi:hypothetical protein
MMNDEELDSLIREVESQVEQLPDENKQRLDRAGRKHQALVLSRARILNVIKTARAEGDFRKEIRAVMEYSILMKYAPKNIFMYSLMKARLNSWMFW